MNLRQPLFAVCFLAYFLAACDVTPEDAAGSSEDREAAPVDAMQKPRTAAERREFRERIGADQAEKFRGLDRAPADEADPVTGEVPDEILDQIIQGLMTNVAAGRDDIEVLHAESLIWNDGSLDCGKPGEVHMQAQVPGYRVILGHAGQQFDYRATERGLIILCEQPGLAAPGAGSNPPVQ